MPLNYCSVLLSGLSETSTDQLQLEQNTDARVSSGTRKMAHITLILTLLHWLPDSLGILFSQRSWYLSINLFMVFLPDPLTLYCS